MNGEIGLFDIPEKWKRKVTRIINKLRGIMAPFNVLSVFRSTWKLTKNRPSSIRESLEITLPKTEEAGKWIRKIEKCNVPYVATLLQVNSLGISVRAATWLIGSAATVATPSQRPLRRRSVKSAKKNVLSSISPVIRRNVAGRARSTPGFNAGLLFSKILAAGERHARAVQIACHTDNALKSLDYSRFNFRGVNSERTIGG